MLGDGSEGGKYEVCVLTRREMTKAEMMSGCYYCCWHSTKMFHRWDVLLRSPADSSSHRAQRHKILLLSKTWLIHSSGSAPCACSLLSDKLHFCDCGDQYHSDCAELISLHHLKPWLGTGKGSSEVNPLLKPGNHVPIHQCLSQSRVAAKTTPTSWG